MASQSFEARARRRNSAIDRRNAKIIAKNPLFFATGTLDQVVQLDMRHWDALSVAYDEIARGIETYERTIRWEKAEKLRYSIYYTMLCEAIAEENAEEVVADYEQRWPVGHSMRQLSYFNNYLNNYIAKFLGRTPIDVFEEAKQREAAMS